MRPLAMIPLCLCALALSASSLAAQSRFDVAYGAGLTLLNGDDQGMQIYLSAQTRAPSTFAPRADIVMEEGDGRGLIALANVMYTPMQRDIAPYAIVGTGVYFDNGTPMAIAVGAGVELRTTFRAPMRLEGRLLSTSEQRVAFTAGFRL